MFTTTPSSTVSAAVMNTEGVEGLTLDDDNNNVVISTTEGDLEGGDNLNLCLVGRFLTDRPIRLQVMKDRMADVSIRELEDGLFLFQLFHQVDVQRVLKGVPWSFDKHLLILSIVQEGIMPNQMLLFGVPFWVQVHYLPPGFMSETVGRSLAGCLGELLEYDVKNSPGFWRTYMRLRELLDVRRPLM